MDALPDTRRTAPKIKRSLLSKFVQTLLIVAGVIGVSTLAIVFVMSAQASSQHLQSVQRYIEEGIASKGKVLTQNHALALRSLTLDNAFLDMQRLVERAIKDDADLVYGIYVSSERETLALARQRAGLGDQSPEREAWRGLGLAEQELLVKSLRVERRHRLGADLLEVAAPVIGEDGELLGTVRYGLSTARMHDAIAGANVEAATRLKRSVLLIGSLVSLTMLAGLLLSRLQAVRITRPIDELTQAAQKLAGGDRAVRVKIESKDELELLGSSFNRMVEDLDTSYRNLEEMNRTLEQKVNERTLELAQKNRDMRLVLDNVDQGFITLSPDGKMAAEHSLQVSTWFGASEGQLPFWEYLGRISERFAGPFRMGWEQLADDFLPVEVCLAQLPERLTHLGRTWSFRYLPFYRNEKLEGVLVVVADITARLAREREDQEHAELMQAFKRLVQDRAGFEVFLAESGEMLQAICKRKLDADQVLLKRALHTLKGNAASMGLTLFAQLCHQLENELLETGTMPDETLVALSSRWKAMTDHIASSGGMQTQRMIEIPESEYAELVGKLSEAAPRRELVQKLLAWQAEPAERALGRLADQARSMARRLGKGEIRVEIDAGGVRLDRTAYIPFFSEAVHVIRNAVDHGFEDGEERRNSGKAPEGTLRLRARASETTVTIEIADDGAGIDWKSIARLAAARGLPHKTDEDLLNALCHDGLTTRSEVTAISGRGVGMAAFRQRVLAMQGRLEVRSTRGVGTAWVAHLPRLTHEPSEPRSSQGHGRAPAPRALAKAGRLEGAGG